MVHMKKMVEVSFVPCAAGDMLVPPPSFCTECWSLYLVVLRIFLFFLVLFVNNGTSHFGQSHCLQINIANCIFEWRKTSLVALPH